MSKEEDNKALVGRWFTEFWGETCKLSIVDELAAPDMLLKYSLHAPRRGREDIKAFMSGFRKSFPNLHFWGAADLIAGRDRAFHAFHRDDGAQAQRRQDHRRSGARQWRDRAPATWAHPGGLT